MLSPYFFAAEDWREQIPKFKFPVTSVVEKRLVPRGWRTLPGADAIVKTPLAPVVQKPVVSRVISELSPAPVIVEKPVVSSVQTVKEKPVVSRTNSTIASTLGASTVSEPVKLPAIFDGVDRRLLGWAATAGLYILLR